VASLRVFRKGSAPCPLASRCSRAAAYGEEKTLASSNHDKLLFCIGRHGEQRTFASVIQNQSDCFAQICQALLPSFALTVCARHLGAVGDAPRAVPFHNRRELVAHAFVLARTEDVDWLPMTIRPAEPRDIDAISQIQGRSSWRPEEYLDFDCRVAEHGGVVQGFLASRQIAAGEREILFIAVDPAYRRRGIAKGLLQNELDSSRGAWFLEVRESNLAAIRLYETLGFQTAGRREEYYSDPPEAAIVMRFFS
jgi:ribosomal-protein-alanine N-acetyltransferase